MCLSVRDQDIPKKEIKICDANAKIKDSLL